MVNALSEAIFSSLAREKALEYQEVFPLFGEVRIETRTRCNGHCNFCPVSVEEDTRPDLLMSEACHQKIVDELATLNYTGHVGYYINNEPLMDNRIVKFVTYLNSKKLKLRHIRIQTNGLGLTKRLGEDLLANGLTWLIINDYSKDGTKSQRLIDVSHYLKEKFPEKKIHFRHRDATQIMSNRAALAPNRKDRVSIKACCKYPFYQLNITANGNVGLCCLDVAIQNPLGNVLQQSLKEIWEGPVYQKFRRRMFEGDRSTYDICRGCDFKGYTSPPKKHRWVKQSLTQLAKALSPEAW